MNSFGSILLKIQEANSKEGFAVTACICREGTSHESTVVGCGEMPGKITPELVAFDKLSEFIYICLLVVMALHKL